LNNIMKIIFSWFYLRNLLILPNQQQHSVLISSLFQFSLELFVVYLFLLIRNMVNSFTRLLPNHLYLTFLTLGWNVNAKQIRN
jgi:hypothetical protein